MNASKPVSSISFVPMQDCVYAEKWDGASQPVCDVDLWDGDWFLSHSPIIRLGMVLSKGVQEKTHR